MTHAFQPAWRPRETDRALFEDAHFTDVWNDAQNARTAVVRVHVESLIRQIRRALTNRIGIAAPGSDRKAGVPDIG